MIFQVRLSRGRTVVSKMDNSFYCNFDLTACRLAKQIHVTKRSHSNYLADLKISYRQSHQQNLLYRPAQSTSHMYALIETD